MATKKVKKANFSKARALVKKINTDLIDASFEAIENTAKTGEKWQKLATKLIKKAEPLTKKQKEMVVASAEAIKGQLNSGTERLKNFVGYDPKKMEETKKTIAENPVVEKAVEVKEKIEKEIANNKLVVKAEEIANKITQKISSTIEDVKEKIDEYTEEAMEATAKEKKKKAPKPKKVAVPKSDKNDDLKAIKRIGPKLEEVLGTIGFTAYEQLAKLSIKDLTKLLSDAGINTKMYDLSSWKKQAKALATA